MKIRQFRYGADNLGYLVYTGSTAMAIDGVAPEEILSFAESQNLQLAYVTNTHSHMDHTTGNQALLNGSDAKLLDFAALLETGQVNIDGNPVRVMHTPGHTRDSVCFWFENILISGDTLFNGKVGRCFTGDFPGFLASIKQILELPPEILVYAGHDYVEEYVAFIRSMEPDNPYLDAYLKQYDPNHVCATLADERRVDPFLRFNDEKIIDILKARGLPADSELERWESLMSLM